MIFVIIFNVSYKVDDILVSVDGCDDEVYGIVLPCLAPSSLSFISCKQHNDSVAQGLELVL